jgi:hypothetical protein
MKKVLILAYDFPPYNSVGGLRPYSWFKYFKSFGVEPIVITRQWEKTTDSQLDYITSSKEKKIIYENLDYGRILRTPYTSNLANRIYLKHGENKFSFLRKIISAYYEIGQYLFKIGPKKEIYFGAKEFLKNNKVDAIIATGDPFVLFKYASILSKEFDVPWLADYRDDWIDNHVMKNRSKFPNKVLKLYFRLIEKRIMKNAMGISTVSEYLNNQIAGRNSIQSSVIIENGADLENYKNLGSPYLGDDFNILYSGRLYDLDYLFDFERAFEDLLMKYQLNDKIKVHFIGTEVSSNMATESLKRFKIKFPNNIIIEKSKSTQEIAQYQMNANILLNLIAGDPEKGLIGAKSYNYAVTRNPILTIPSIKNKVSAFFPGRDIQFVATNPKEVFEFLEFHYLNYIKKIQWKSSLTDKEQFELSRKYNAEKLLKFISNNINGNSK